MNEEEKELEYIDFEEILDIVKIKQGKSNFSITKTNQILQDSQYQYNLIDKWKCFQISESKIKFKNIKIKVIDSIHNNKDNYGYISIDRTRFRVKSLEFTECKIDNMYFEKSTFITDLELNNSNVECLKITNSTLDNFLINKKRSTYSIHFLKNNDIKCIYARSNKFSKNFSISSCDIKSFEFIDNNFLKKIRIKNINFEGLMVFDTCHFYSKTVFEQVTFKSVVQFRNSIFYNGIDLESTNIEKEINFFGVNLDEPKNIKETSQETYRIIKYNFDKIGNIIEATKYHACELQKKKEALNQEEENLQDSLVFNFNWYSSRFGGSWGLALFWIFIVGVFSTFTVYKGIITWLFNPEEAIKLSANFISHFDKFITFDNILFLLDETFKYMSITTRLKDNNFGSSSILFFFNKALLGFLYYQFIVAVRKDTKR